MKHSHIYDINQVTQRNIQRITMCACVGDRKDILHSNLNASNVLYVNMYQHEYSTVSTAHTRTITTTAP